MLALAAVVIPLVEPRLYVPVDPDHSVSESSPEQTASLLSTWLFAYLDRAFSRLCASSTCLSTNFRLAGRRYGTAPRSGRFSPLDTLHSKKRQHAAWGLLKVFRFDFLFIGVLMSLHAFALLANPFGMKMLLGTSRREERAL
ncbi:uncharacterized protein B0H18DRAFT_384876 [Fomitopsis serialis]|uniref:uncharacterized protein n=1 Tax=Fomitopsis serialis TaxID=139415 RepID=UPI002007DF65|nr:uncharacterized protein B0H18DRAFT_384876 [Neoantrodia serialis]KAH9911187.1 hypothetical protein B0H18DRAFT_384876 [Neoantrodia serialis]